MREIVKEILGTNYKCVLAVTGGGSIAISELLKYGGASGFLLEAQVPYHTGALIDFIKGPFDKACSPVTARAMAVAAYERAIALAPNGSVQIGVAATCKLAKENERVGRNHEIYVAVHAQFSTRIFSIKLEEGLKREIEEDTAARAIIHAIAVTCTGNRPFENIITSQDFATCANPILEVMHGTQPYAIAAAWNGYHTQKNRVIFPGSFNPIHDGHIEMLEVAVARAKAEVVDLEVAIRNVSKPTLDYISIKERIKQISENVSHLKHTGELLLTNAPKFVDKAIFFPGSTFVIGADTFNRLSESDDHYAFREFDRLCIKFMVFARKDVPFLKKHKKLNILCDFVPPDIYMDQGHSSTKIRNGN